MKRGWAARPTLHAATAFALLITGTGLASCSTIPAIPADADGTYNRVAGGTLVVGVSPREPWTIVDTQRAEMRGGAGAVRGTDAELVEKFAREIGADVQWRVGSESDLARWIEDREVDIAIGGLAQDAPWEDSMALTRPYKPTGGTVMGVGLGENRMLTELERFLSREAGEI